MTRFGLPVFKGGTGPVTPEDLVRQAQRIEEESFLVLGERIEFEFGAGIISEEFPGTSRANQVREVVFKEEGQGGREEAEKMVREVDAAYGTRGVKCRQWHFAGGAAPPALREVLEEQGFITETFRLWTLTQAGKLDSRKDLLVIPSRSALEALREVTIADGQARGADEEYTVQWGASSVRQMDDLQTDGFLALEGPKPLGAIYLLVSGEMGFIWNLFVLPEHQGKKVATTLLERTIELAGRARLKRVCLFCDANNLPATMLYKRAGFTDVATVTRMVRQRKP